MLEPLKNKIINKRNIVTATPLVILLFLLITNLGYIGDIIWNPIYSKLAFENRNDPFVNKVVEKCNGYETFRGRVDCVYLEIFENFDYVRKDFNFFPPFFTSPSETINNGGMCGDIALTYKAIFERLNIKSKVSLVLDHIFVIAYSDENKGAYCILNMDEKECF